MDILSCRLFYDWTAQDCQQGFGTSYRQWSNFRLTRGIYYYLKIDEILGFGVLYPSIEEIAERNKHIVTYYNQSVFKEKFHRTEHNFVKLKCEYEELKYDYEKLKKEYEHQKNKSLFERIFNK